MRHALCRAAECNNMSKYIQIIAITVALTLLSSACEAQREHLIQGRTMGTTYQVKVVAGYIQSVSGLKAKIDDRLEEINRRMSTYQKDSEISRFNSSREVGQKYQISDDFFQVMRAGQKIHRLSDGAWDGTVNPLVDLWGFGRGGRQDQIPPQSEIAARLAEVGFANIDVVDPGFLVKKRAAVTVDLSAIAKGYGVDQVAALLRSKGFENFLVEIGGEVYAAGHREDGRQWRIGINRPRLDAAFDDVYKVVALRNKGFATSGDYRNFFEIDGVRYSHVIDPRTGYPVSNGVVSVSIITGTCAMADGLATAVMVMGVGKGMELIDRLDGVEGLIVVEQNDGMLADYPSRGFELGP